MADPTTKDMGQYIHRVKVLNLPKREMGSVKQLFQSHGVMERHKKAPAWDYAYINYETEAAAKEAMKKLNGLPFKKKFLTTEYSRISEETFRKRFENKKKEVVVDTRTPTERLAHQLKHNFGRKYMASLKRKIAQLPEMSDAGRKQVAWAFNREGYCEMLDPIASPKTDGYRTKCEFTIGRNLDNEPAVGFLLGMYREGITSVMDSSECLHVPNIAKRIAKAMEGYVRASVYDVYDRSERTGVWRSVMVKTQHTGDGKEPMKASGLTDDQLAAEKENLKKYWTSLEGINVKTLLLQIWDGDSNGLNEEAQTEVLMGDGYVYEELLGSRFRISHNAFFQVNTPAAELLYAKCAEWCNLDQHKKTTLLDLCCGTGTIGITMAKSVDRVVGIEMIPEAVVDAKMNAKTNNIVNTQFYAGKIEEKIDLVTKEENDAVVAVLDPPRSGVHSSVIRAVRESPQIEKVIYISCDAKQAMQNFIGLCRPTSNRFKGLPFRPLRAVSVDLFPHTEHSELLIEFVRIQEDQGPTDCHAVSQEEK
ncbi:tRNA methyltransferase 2 [Apophysomyces sp. BC1034]|nr:tRNA methyltransferase 2 [Apophysomyces sp. BC1015]KAG0179141.1 tRNA methyltransferase 2 [Apophysomyces sp. BC1021]KAG0189803.1 tRNA methyltransferase 2 [Apophysomyces sp. BC1034]